MIFIIVSLKKMLYNFNFRPNSVFIWNIVLFWIIYSGYAYTASWFKVKYLMDQWIYPLLEVLWEMISLLMFGIMKV